MLSTVLHMASLFQVSILNVAFPERFPPNSIIPSFLLIVSHLMITLFFLLCHPHKNVKFLKVRN